VLAMLAALLLLLTVWRPAQAQNVTYSEVKLGINDHDTTLLGGREHGIDINPELLLASPVDDAWAATVPVWVRWLVQPRFTIGGQINTAGETNQAYFGATWGWRLASDIFMPNDGFVVGFFFGPGFNDGQIDGANPARKGLGSHVLFREALDLGYEINRTYTISLFVDHISNGGLARLNQSINDIGVRLGVRF
jgi:hypothetical protein